MSENVEKEREILAAVRETAIAALPGLSPDDLTAAIVPISLAAIGEPPCVGLRDDGPVRSRNVGAFMVRYGVVSGRTLRPEVIERIERDGVSTTRAAATAEEERRFGSAFEGPADSLPEELAKHMEKWAEDAEFEEEEFVAVLPTRAGSVSVLLSWLGGAQIVFVTRSPFLTRRGLCSPCVPGAVDLDSGESADGSIGYDVPPDWREEGEAP